MRLHGIISLSTARRATPRFTCVRGQRGERSRHSVDEPIKVDRGSRLFSIRTTINTHIGPIERHGNEDSDRGWDGGRATTGEDREETRRRESRE